MHTRRSGATVALVACLAIAAGWMALDAARAAGQGNGKNQGVIDFEGLPPGTIVDELSAGNGVSGNIDGVIRVLSFNGVDAANSAMIFDSSCEPGYTPESCSGRDPDLGTPNEAFKFKPLPGSPIPGPGSGDGGFPSNKSPEGNILIPSEDFDSADPDDADEHGMFTDFDFSEALGGTDDRVTINNVSIIDVDSAQGEGGAYVELWTEGLTPPTAPTDMFAIAPAGDNGRTDIKNIKLDDVNYMRVNMNGSAGILSVVFGAREKGTCWSTSGGFQNAGISSGSKDYTFGGNVGPPPSGVWEVVDHVSGDNFHSNDVDVIECLIVEALTGPEQPGGKKGLQENLLRFRGTGRIRNGATGEVTDGHPFEGCVIDSGEPAGQQGLDRDYFEIVVCDNSEADCSIGSGLCATSTTSADLVAPGPQDTCDALGSPVVFAACGALDGGNFQIHPPVGN